MDNTIHILSEEMANKIAAGEVVERPASVVKELVENSIDAGAKNIHITIENSGRGLIRIKDDGKGMGKDDALLSFERHATSKIKTDYDLHAIGTLGFRGEALPSIASVSKIALTTSMGSSHNAVGTKLYVTGGIIKEVKEVAYPRGTTIEVSNLFYNTPARAKFLKSNTTELGHISGTIIKQSLSKPNLSVTLKYNNRTLVQAPGVASHEEIKNKIAAHFGNELTSSLLLVNASHDSTSINGYICAPTVSRSTRENQYIFLNNRFIRDKVITHAITEAYRRVIPSGRHPIVFLYLKMDPTGVDVNVHPSKLEVRFYKQQKVHEFIKQALIESLYKKGFQENFITPKASFPAHPVESKKITSSSIPYNFSKKMDSDGIYKKKQVFFDAVANHNRSPEYKPSPTPSKEKTFRPSPIQKEIGLFSSSPAAIAPSISNEFNPIGQINKSFIVLEGKEGMVLIDQHTAHERVLYETLFESIKKSEIKIQPLLLPLQFELNKKEAILLSANKNSISKLGFEIEPFGPQTFLIRAVPEQLSNSDCKKIVLDLVDKLISHEKAGSLTDTMDSFIATMACHLAVKANQKLEMQEIEHIISLLKNTSLPYTCPHGRPIALLFPIYDIEKKFMRK